MGETIPPPQWGSFPHGGECHTHSGSPSPTGETNILPVRGVSPPPGEIVRLPQGESCRTTHTQGGVAI